MAANPLASTDNHVLPGRGISIFADGADLEEMLTAYRSGVVRGFTTNPTLMRKSGITNYAVFAKSVLERIPDLPISFEVFADDFVEMERQALMIAGWGKNVFVKIPVTNTHGASSAALIHRLAEKGVKLNVTALTTTDQVAEVCGSLLPNVDSVISVFAGRIADTGRDPIPTMIESVRIAAVLPKASVLWASPREVLNVYQAESCGCHIITVTQPLLDKLSFRGKDLSQLSLETVRMFHSDAEKAGYTL